MCFLKEDQFYLRNRVKFYYYALPTTWEEFGKVEQLPRLEGKRMIVSFSPKKKK